MNLTYLRPEMRRNVDRKQQPSQHHICRQNIKHQKFIWEHHIWWHVNISEVAALVSIIPNYGAVSRLPQPNCTFVSSQRVTFVETHFSSEGYGYYPCVKPLNHMLLRGPSEKVLIQGWHVGPLGAISQKFGPKSHLLAPKFSFGPFPG